MLNATKFQLNPIAPTSFIVVCVFACCCFLSSCSVVFKSKEQTKSFYCYFCPVFLPMLQINCSFECKRQFFFLFIPLAFASFQFSLPPLHRISPFRSISRFLSLSLFRSLIRLFVLYSIVNILFESYFACRNVLVACVFICFSHAHTFYICWIFALSCSVLISIDRAMKLCYLNQIKLTTYM